MHIKARERARELMPLLETLKKMKKTALCSVIPFLNDEASEMICASVYTVLHSTSSLSRRKRRYLKKKLADKKHVLRSLSNLNSSIQSRKKKLPQVGGALALILATVIPILAQLLLGK